MKYLNASWKGNVIPDERSFCGLFMLFSSCWSFGFLSAEDVETFIPYKQDTTTSPCFLSTAILWFSLTAFSLVSILEIIYRLWQFPRKEAFLLSLFQ